MTKRKQRRTRQMSEINVVPYIDVMLVLLVIFMITTPLLTQGVKINLPQAKAKALTDNKTKPLIVSVDAHGRYYLNLNSQPNKPISENALLTRVAAQVVFDKQQHIHRPFSRLIKYGITTAFL